MSPTPEQITAMRARGWKWSEQRMAFLVNSKQVDGWSSIHMEVKRGVTWAAEYGTTGMTFGGLLRHATPESAAEEAESWLRKVLSGLQFPWLSCQVQTFEGDPS